jgi:hypothetical protein
MPAPEPIPPSYFEFPSPDALLEGIDAARAMGHAELDTFTPYPMPEAEEKLGLPRTRIPIAVFLFGLLGCAVAYLILWFCNAWDYPLDVGGRPLDSIPADIPIMFETTVLFAGTTAFFSVLFLSRMPRLHHPIQEVPGSESITLDKFWLKVGGTHADDPELRARLVDLGANPVGGAP